MTRFPLSLALLILLACLTWTPGPHAQSSVEDADGGGAPSGPSRAVLEARIAELEADKTLDADLRSRIVAAYRDALNALEAAASHRARTEAFQDTAASAPAETRKLRDELPSLEAAPTDLRGIGLGPDAALPELEGRLAREEGELGALESQLAELEKRLQAEQTRPAQARQRLADLAGERDAAEQKLQTAAPADEPAELTRARQALRRARVDALDAEARMLEQELLTQASRLELLRARRDRLAALVSSARERAELLRQTVNERRRAETEKVRVEAMAAQQESAGKHPLVRELAADNAELAQEVAELTVELDELARQREGMEERTTELQQSLQTTRQRLEVGGLSETLGRVLLEERSKLPDLRQARREIAGLRDRLAEMSLAEVRLEEERRELADLPGRVEGLLDRIPAAELAGEERERLRGELSALLEDRRRLVDKAVADYAAYVSALADLDLAHQRFVDTLDTYAELLDEHLLWIPSAPPMGLDSARHLLDGALWLVQSAHWYEAGQDLVESLRRSPVLFAGGLILFGLLLALRRRLRAALSDIGTRVGKVQTDRYTLTLLALGATLLLALPGPLLVWLTATLLVRLPDASAFTQALGRALGVVAPALLGTLLFLWLTARQGVGEAHFRWQPITLRMLRHAIPRLAAVGIPAGFLAVLAANAAPTDLRYSLSRAAFLVVMGALAWFLARLLSPEKGVTHSYVLEHPQGVLARLRKVWYPAVVGLPLALVVLAAVGYFYTAGQLAGQLVDSLWLILTAVVGHDLFVRWLALTRRRLAWKLARERRDAARAAQDAGTAGPEVPPPPPEDTIDLEVVDTQTRRLVHALIGWSLVVGLYLIWQDVLPALGMLREIALWEQTVTEGGEEVVRPITLAAVLLAAVVGIVTAVAARNLPGVLEIAFLQRLNIDPGTRYAAATLSRYFIVGAGVVLVFQKLGASWSSIQWLVAALGVGLGFGLQEIFGNFVSGLIILFERPIRVGDTVTVGDLSGTVSRIRIRATTITDWDRKEIIVPNKSFITERVVNWTLSDPITRLVIPVGVAYGTDTVLAHRVMLETVEALPLVLDEPEPRVYFDGFGESSLDFKLYVHASQLADRLPLKHEVHMAVNRALAEHGIQIPFPQRDIHVRSTPRSRGGRAGTGEEPSS